MAASLLLLVALNSQGLLSAESGGTPEIVHLYRESPTEAHEYLRRLYSEPLPVEPDVREILAATGDHSFDGFLVPFADAREAAVSEYRAWSLWEAGRGPEAVTAYRRANRLYLAAGAYQSAAFCLYAAAEILSESERYPESLELIEEALALAIATPQPAYYLNAVLSESLGYSLWFLDQLPSSIRAFSNALENWRKVGYQLGVTTSWNNLAALLEELHLPSRAKDSYESALASLPADAPPFLLFQLLRNYAVFCSRQGQQEDAERLFDRMKPVREYSPDEYRLCQAEVSGKADDLIDFRSSLESLNIEALLLRGKAKLSSVELESALDLFRAARWRARDSDLAHYSRQAALHLGKTLESMTQFDEAASVYREALEGSLRRSSQGTELPYGNAVSEHFDGWLRCLVKTGRVDEALREIHRRDRLRREHFLRTTTALTLKGPMSDLELLIQLHRSTAEKGLPIPASQPPPAPRRPPTEYTVLEFWPDGANVYAWISHAGRTRFRRFDLGRELTSLIEPIIDPFYNTKSHLPPPPKRTHLERLYRSLLEPLADEISTRRVQLVPHKELEALPFELLQSTLGASGKPPWLISYAPAAGLSPLPDRFMASAVVLTPLEADNVPGVQDELDFFRKFDAGVRVTNSASAPREINARWIHVADHFRSHPGFWQASAFGPDSHPVAIGQLMNHRFTCRLLSLAVCEAGNGWSNGSPFWMGFVEPFLARGAGAIVLSRWSLDQAATSIFTDFYAYSRAGHPMDEALELAREAFRARTIRRGGVSVPGSHPFFWAGISYVGPPGAHLFPEGTPAPDFPINFAATLLLIATAVAIGLLGIGAFLGSFAK